MKFSYLALVYDSVQTGKIPIHKILGIFIEEALVRGVGNGPTL